jgi:hypothetical protein
LPGKTTESSRHTQLLASITCLAALQENKPDSVPLQSVFILNFNCMHKITLPFFISLLTTQVLLGQISVQVTKDAQDSLMVSFPENLKLEMTKTYEFVFNTNVTLQDSVSEGFTHQYLYDGLKVSVKIEHYELGFFLRHKKKEEFLATSIFYITGTSKWKFNLDGQYVSRYYPFDITDTSVIDIELQSDLYDISKAQYDYPAVMYWTSNQRVHEKLFFQGNKIHIDLTEYRQFFKGMKRSGTYDNICFLLPQVNVDGEKLFKDEQKYRCYYFRVLNK